jgi:23S rRNA pseudouridine955/2504/2580 synthase/23S rRNA pseudouridine1911/1915/1917 synthase
MEFESGQIVRQAQPKSARKAANQLEILFEDTDVVAISKPAGLAAIPGRDEQDTVLERLSSQLGIPCQGSADQRLRVVHRLDKDTSGVLLMAKNVAAQRALCAQFLKGEVAKEYLAIVYGRPAAYEGTIDAPIGRHPSSPRQMAIVKTGRPSVTQWRLEKRLGPFSLVRCFPKTGRTHQIRVHMKSIGLPLAVDPLYNDRRGGEPGIFLSHLKPDYRSGRHEERPLIGRLTLHAQKLAFKHPDGRLIDLECPPPKDFCAAVMQLGKLRGG